MVSIVVESRHRFTVIKMNGLFDHVGHVFLDKSKVDLSFQVACDIRFASRLTRVGNPKVPKDIMYAGVYISFQVKSWQ